MYKHSTNDITRTISVTPCVAGIHLDYSLGEELPLFGPPKDKKLTYGVGYNSKDRRKDTGLPYFKAGKGTPYKTWSNMMRRAYGPKRAAAYEDCSVCLKWHDYQEFAAWYSMQPYAFETDAELDKDILDSLNTVYSPEHCSVVPKLINQIFRNTRNRRGKLPIGVSIASGGNRFVSVLSMYGKPVALGTFLDITEAFRAYQAAHRAYCNELVEKYTDKIDLRVIERLRTCSRHIRD
ncbi:hypothetical protein ABZR71_12930 [Pseudomonas paraeruginosa]|uniref:hypothetical protein n=1 Tax=Pseudomonas aeruginosa group TaxID=136841 RepID=UPI00071B0B4F|nr:MULTISPECIES: hypothetical protein [Pseudomonas aeruginosa group]KSF77885.1 hypothetical protein AO940_16790 [Pseudomonas aeruginosa]